MTKMFKLSSPKHWSPFQMVLGNCSDKPPLYHACQRLLYTKVAWDSSWNTLSPAHTIWKSLALSWIFLISRRGCPLRLCSFHPQRFLRPGWVKSWATGSELTGEPAWSSRLGWKPAEVPSTCVVLGILTQLVWAEDGRVAGSSVWFFTTASVSASWKEKMSCFKHFTRSIFCSTLVDF